MSNSYVSELKEANLQDESKKLSERILSYSFSYY
jgi:hypothetical protein